MNKQKLRMAKASLPARGQPIRVTCHFCDWQQIGSGADVLASATRLRNELITHVEAAHADRFPIEPHGEVGFVSVPVSAKEQTS